MAEMTTGTGDMMAEMTTGTGDMMAEMTMGTGDMRSTCVAGATGEAGQAGLCNTHPPRPPTPAPAALPPFPGPSHPAPPARSSAEASRTKRAGLAGRAGGGGHVGGGGEQRRAARARGPRPKPGRQGALYRRRPPPGQCAAARCSPGATAPQRAPPAVPLRRPLPGGAQASPAGLLGRRPQPLGPAVPRRAPAPARPSQTAPPRPRSAPRPPPPAPDRTAHAHCARRLHRQRHPAPARRAVLRRRSSWRAGPRGQRAGPGGRTRLEAAHLAAGRDRIKEGLEVGRGLVVQQGGAWHHSPGSQAQRTRAWRRGGAWQLGGAGRGSHLGAGPGWVPAALREAALRAQRPGGRGLRELRRKSGILRSFVFAQWEGFHRLTDPPCP
ncbi:hypothetical protein AB1E18_006937 [Capra hircus]